MPTVLSSRKLTPAQAGLLLNAGISYVDYDAIQIEEVDFQITSTVENAILTSKNAVRQVHKSKINIQNCFCVGEKTKAFLQEMGFSIRETAHYGKELAKSIVEKHPDEQFTFFCGDKRRPELPKILTEHHIDFEEITVYKTLLNSKEFKQAFDGIMFFSPSQVKSFTQKNSLNGHTAFCIGKTTAAEAEKHTENLIIATTPTVENVIVQVVKNFKK